MDRQGKEVVVSALKSELQKAALVVVSHQSGLDAAQSRALRNTARANKAGIKVLKNTLAKLALQGGDFDYLQNTMKGPTVITWSTDPVAAAKVIGDMAKTTDKIKIIAGGAPKKEMALADVMVLSTLPSMDALRGKLVGVLYAPGAKLARVMALRSAQAA
ncbi:MAG: 50S ribosomal protein L10 [Hydrotalea sp.]|nr:50S ribosomal protein L10 [Hydrotalea sp.]